MTCVQPNCKYQFCWECSGDYHTSSTCNRPKIKPDSNSILQFDELDRQCANYFLAKKVALKSKKEIDRLLSQSDKHREVMICRLISEAWRVLAAAQSALAHTCIMMFNIKSARLQFLYDHQKEMTQSLQQKFEEVWIHLDDFPIDEAKAAVTDLKYRLKDYLLSIQTEIIHTESANQVAGQSSNSIGANSSNRNGIRSTMESTKKSPYRNKQRSLSSLSEQDNLINPASNEYYDIVDRISSFSLEEKSQLANAVFGDEFGGSLKIYSLVP
jgi:uncharacterized protein YbaR (Trm112 family)